MFRRFVRLGHIPMAVLGMVAAGTLPRGLVLAADPTPDTPAERRAHELVELVNSDQRGASEALQEILSPRFLKEQPLDHHLHSIREIKRRSGGLELVGLRNLTPFEVVARLRTIATEELIDLRVRVEEASTHRVIAVGLGAAPSASSDASGGAVLEQEESSRPPGAGLSDVSAYIERLAARDAFSGAVLIKVGDETVLDAAYGLAERNHEVANTVETRFNIGSMNKMFTAVAIMQLASSGRINLEDAVSEYLDDVPNAENARQITIRHLLTHTSGLGDYMATLMERGGRDRYRSVEDLLELARGDSLSFEPGTRRRYSNTGYLVLGRIIEIVSGQPYADYVKRHIFEPASMSSTNVSDLDGPQPGMATGYVRRDDGSYRSNVLLHVARGGPAGGGVSTVGDLARFLEALFSGKLVGEQYVAQLVTAKPALHSPRYGYGFAVDSEREIVGHTGGFPGISASLEVHLPSGTMAAVLSNYGDGAQPVAARIREQLFR